MGAASIDDSKLKKNVLARGVDDLVMVADDALAALDTAGTAEELAAIVGEGGFDLILCGDGSADEYAQQVDVQPVSYTHLDCQMMRPSHRNLW